MSDRLIVGDQLGDEEDSYCGGYFGRDSHYIKRVEAVGADWVVAREVPYGDIAFAYGPRIHEDLAEYVCTRNGR